MLLKQILKKAPILGAFFIVLLVLNSSDAFARNCISDALSTPEKATVKWVYDGDTLLLTDKRKIRLIGIDTPEVKHHKQKAQAYGAKAREALRELLKRNNYKILLRFEKEKLDRFSRLLAHVYTPDGMNISNWLLEEGFARTLSIPPNILLAECYKRSEKMAKEQSLKIWRLKSHQPLNAEGLSIRRKGYVRLQGKIDKIKYRKKSIMIELATKNKRPIRIKISNKNLRYFKKDMLENLLGSRIEISGILKKRHGKRTIYLNYPTQISTLKTKAKKVAPMIKWSLQK